MHYDGGEDTLGRALALGEPVRWNQASTHQTAEHCFGVHVLRSAPTHTHMDSRGTERRTEHALGNTLRTN